MDFYHMIDKKGVSFQTYRPVTYIATHSKKKKKERNVKMCEFVENDVKSRCSSREALFFAEGTSPLEISLGNHLSLPETKTLLTLLPSLVSLRTV